MMTLPTLRRAGPEDAVVLSRLGERTFRETFIDDFAIPYPAEDLAVFVPQTYGIEPTRRMLADPAIPVWIAEHDGEAVGYAVAGPCTLPYPEALPGEGELRRLYVLKAWQGARLGPALMDLAMAWLERNGPRPIWIGVWSGNLRAQRFYARYGFQTFGEHTFPVGRWTDHELALRRD